MRPTLNRLRTLAAGFAALALAGCMDGGPAQLPSMPPAAAVRYSQDGGLKKMSGGLPAFSVSSVIGPEGGSLGVPGYTVTVLPGTVAQPTAFTFESLSNGYVEVNLTATRVGSSTVNDVGSAGFKTPVMLSLSFDAAGGLPEWLRLVVAWDRPDGTLEAVPTNINPAQKVIVGRLSHFSQYVVAGD